MNDEIVCRHLELSVQDIINAIKENNLTHLEDVLEETEAGSVCGSCVMDINLILEKVKMGEM